MEMAMASPQAPRGGCPGGSGAVIRQDKSFPNLRPLVEDSPVTSSSGKRLMTRRLWKEFFTNPSQWLDNRSSKASSEAPDFKHKITNELLWIDGWYNPGWVKTILEEKESESKDSHGVKASTGQDPSIFEDRVSLKSVSDVVKASVRSAVRECNAQEFRGNGWEMLSSEETLTSLERTPLLPSLEKFTCILQKCRKEKNVTYAKRLYAYICNSGLEAHGSLGNYLVPLLVECGSMSDAMQVFNGLANRNEYSWTSLITGYMECGESEHALNLYQKMQEDWVHPSKHTFVALLKACARLKDAERGQEIHAEFTRKGFDNDSTLGNTVVDMYSKCGSSAKAREAFDNLQVRDVVSWNALISGYAEHGIGDEALNCFRQMQVEGVTPNAVTFVCSLKACGSIGALDMGREIHYDIARKGLESNLFLGNTLVDMYAKCGSLAKAQQVFDKLPVRDVVSWTALIAGYALHMRGEEALDCFQQMRLEGVCPNAVTFVCSLTACGSTGAIEKGREIHAEIARKGLERNPFLGNAFVDMYAKCGSLAKAREVFDKLPVRNAVSWTALIGGYIQHGLNEEALHCLQLMQQEGVSRDITFWSALIAGYAQLGESSIVFNLLERMRGEGIKPNGVTFLSVLTVCSHAGLVDKAQEYLEAMRKDYGIAPNIEHYTCMIDLLGRVGQLDEAIAMVKKMPFQATLVVWHTVLSACQKWGNVELGRQIFEHVVQLDQKDAAAYVLMSNIYADARMHEDEEVVQAMLERASMGEAS